MADDLFARRGRNRGRAIGGQKGGVGGLDGTNFVSFLDERASRALKLTANRHRLDLGTCHQAEKTMRTDLVGRKSMGIEQESITEFSKIMLTLQRLKLY